MIVDTDVSLANFWDLETGPIDEIKKWREGPNGPPPPCCVFLVSAIDLLCSCSLGVHGSGSHHQTKGRLVDDVSDVVQDVQSIEIGVITCSEEVPNWVDGPTLR